MLRWRMVASILVGGVLLTLPTTAAALPFPPEFAQTESSRLLLNEAKSRK